MVMKKAGHGSVPSNPTVKCKAIFLASLNDFLSDQALKNEDAGNLQEKVSPYGCSTCDKLFPYLYPLGNFQICTSIVMKKAGHGSVPSNPTEKCKATFLASLNDFLSDHALKNEDAGNLQEKVRPYGCSSNNSHAARIFL